jgi:hypothetical protein
MFDHIVPDIKPNPEELEKERERALYNKASTVKDFSVKTFDLGVKKQANEYAKLMQTLYAGIQSKTHAILFNDRRFIEGGNAGPRWIAHIEWIEFELKITANPTVGTPTGGDTDE